MKNIIALLLLALLWVLFWIFMQNGKYVALDEGGFTLLDTRTGTVYHLASSNKREGIVKLSQGVEKVPLEVGG